MSSPDPKETDMHGQERPREGGRFFVPCVLERKGVK
jgi:hypothetical protein